MSQFSGKCDVADLIQGLAGWRDKNGNKVDNTYSGPRYGDEWEDFLVFKKKTKGLLHQHKKVVVSEWNQKDVKERCPQFDFIEHTKIIKDKRLKSGEREEKYFTYTYYGKDYSSLKELNKKGVYITIDIKFETLLDLIPYYPYTVSVCAGDKNGMYIVISDKPWPIKSRDESLKDGGRLFDVWQDYSKNLQEHYREVVLKYYNPEGREVTEELSFEPSASADEKYLAHTSYPMDLSFEPKWIFEDELKIHWSSPTVVDKHTIEMHRHDYQEFLGNTMKVYYVKEK